jgi:repressor LexA
MGGDPAIIRPQPRVENGEIAAVMVQTLLPEATLKIVRRTRGVVSLEPANSALVFKGPRANRSLFRGRGWGLCVKPDEPI